MDMTKMGAFLQALRKEQGLTQEQLGEKLHVSGKTISRWETGAYMVPVDMLLALSELHGVSMNELVCGARLPVKEASEKPAEPPVAVQRHAPAFPLQERKTYWRKKWHTDHRLSLVLLFILHGILQIAGNLLDLLWINVTAALAAISLALMYRNRMDDYVEHHLYDEMLNE